LVGVSIRFISVAILLAGIAARVLQAEVAAASDPATTAVDISVLESQGRFSDIYDQMHPDAQAIIPREAVVGWYEHDFAPLGPGVITVTGVAHVTWTWPVTGKTYPSTAEVSFQQPFADGSITSEVVRLVESDANWHWFFGRSKEFVEEQMARYAQDGVPTAPGSAGACDGVAEWWRSAFPLYLSAEYQAYTINTLMGGGGLAPWMIESYTTSQGDLSAQVEALAAPGAGQDLSADVLGVIRLYLGVLDNIRALGTGMNPLAESGAQAAIV
jgi:hypothetical protein